MMLTSLLRIGSLAIVTAASITHRPDRLSPLSILNSSLPISTSSYDSHFFVLFREFPDQILIEKDTYLLALAAFQHLAHVPWSDAPFEGFYYDDPKSRDPRIIIAIEGQFRFTIKHAMWGLAEAMRHVISRDFISVDAMLYYNYGRGFGPKLVGEIHFRDPHNYRSSRTLPSLGSSFNHTIDLNATTMDTNYMAAVDASNIDVTTDLDGAPVSKKGVFSAVYGSIVGLASRNRLRPLSTVAVVESSGIKLVFRPWELPPRQPFVHYMAIVYMLASLPRQMYRHGFLGGRFVLEIGGHPAARGYIEPGASGNIAVA